MQHTKKYHASNANNISCIILFNASYKSIYHISYKNNKTCIIHTQFTIYHTQTICQTSYTSNISCTTHKQDIMHHAQVSATTTPIMNIFSSNCLPIKGMVRGGSHGLHTFEQRAVQSEQLQQPYSRQGNLRSRFLHLKTKISMKKKQYQGPRGSPAYADLLKEFSQIFLEKSTNEK